jgi:hypothetical protein
VSNFKADIKNSSSKLEIEDTKFEEERERERERELCMVTD